MYPKRIHKELHCLYQKLKPCYTLRPVDDDDVYHLRATIPGPENTPYEGGTFPLKIELPINYPLSPPIVLFTVPVFHPNINSEGQISLNLLSDSWSPAYLLATVLCIVGELMSCANPDDPFDSNIAILYKTDRQQYDRTAREWTQNYAMKLDRN